MLEDISVSVYDGGVVVVSWSSSSGGMVCGRGLSSSSMRVGDCVGSGSCVCCRQGDIKIRE